MHEMEFKYVCLLLVVVKKATVYVYQAQSLNNKQKQKTSHLLSPNRDPCVTILSVTRLNVVHACSIVVHKWVWKLDYPCFSAISISISILLLH